MNQKESLKRLKKEMLKNSMSLRKFLLVYYGIYNDSFDKIKMTHQDIKVLMPGLKRVSFGALLNDKRGLYIGTIISVKDSYGNVAPYIRPKTNNITYRQFNYEENKEENLEDIILNEKLNIHELSKLCRKYKALKRFKDYRIAKKILKSKIDVKVKHYKMEKHILMERDRENEY